jgi:PRTRC genetic system protein B
MNQENSQPSVHSLALVVHSANLGSDQTLSVVAHDVHHQDRKSMLGPGRVFSTRDKQELLGLLSGNLNMSLEMLDERCLAASQETIMWFKPRGKQLVNVQGTELEVPLPSLIFLLHQRQLHIVAYKGNRRPDPDTKLLACGLPNVSRNGSWCSGGNAMPAHPTQSDIEGIERRFFLSPFTHWTGNHVTDAGDMEQFFHDLSEKRSYPVNKLAPATQPLRNGWDDRCVTLKSWMNEIVGA